MATSFPCMVDTTPMAEEIQSVSNHVKGTTAAVITMQSAVIEAENISANKVCTNVNKGFFALIQSQISQKIANKQSRVEALLLHLAQQKRQLLGVKTNMEREYGRIAERYIRIFTGINKQLEQRIYQVDQPVFELVNKHMATASNRMNALTSWVTTSQIEGIVQSQQIIASKMKHNAQIALEQSTNFLAQIGEQRALTQKLLISNAGNQDEKCLIPVMICESVNNSAEIPRTDISTPENLSPANTNLINNVIRETPDLVWKKNENTEYITEEFNKYIDTSNASPRVKELARKLYSSANFESL